jgi:hypothetical protein
MVMADEQTTTMETTEAPPANVPVDPAFEDKGFDSYLPPQESLDDKTPGEVQEIDRTAIVEQWQRGRDSDATEGTEEGPTEEGETQDTEDAAEADEATAKGDDDTEGTEEVDLGFDDALLRDARSLGLTAEAARAYGTGDALRHAIADHRARMGVTQAPVTQQVPETPAPTATKAEEKRFKLELKKVFEAKDEEGEYKYDSEIRQLAASVEDMNEHREAEMAQLRKAHDELRQRDEASEKQRFLLEFDAAVKGLPKGYDGFLGKGDSLGLPRSGEEYRNRSALIDDVWLHREDAKRLGRMVPPTKALVDRSVNSLFTDKIKKLDRSELAKSVKRREKQITARPSSRRTQRVVTDHVAEAHRKAKEWAREKGL